MGNDADKFHDLAKTAGNKLKAYIMAFSSGAVGVFFVSVSQGDELNLNNSEKWLLLFGMLSFVITVLLCLVELRLDARRFFHIAKENEKKNAFARNWRLAEEYKKLRLHAINASYIFCFLGMVFTFIYFLFMLFC